MAGTVTVGCKLSAGYSMQLFKMQEFEDQVMGGGVRKSNRAVHSGEPVRLNGSGKAIGKDVPWEIISGVGLTHGVDADFFAKWLQDNKDSSVVQGGYIFAHAKTGEVIAEAKDKISVKTGLEPLNPNKMPDEFQPIKTAQGV